LCSSGAPISMSAGVPPHIRCELPKPPTVGWGNGQKKGKASSTRIAKWYGQGEQEGQKKGRVEGERKEREVGREGTVPLNFGG